MKGCIILMIRGNRVAQPLGCPVLKPLGFCAKTVIKPLGFVKSLKALERDRINPVLPLPIKMIRKVLYLTRFVKESE